MYECKHGASQVALAVKSPSANSRDIRDMVYIPRLGRSGRGNGNPFQYSCLENPMDRGAWWAIVAQSRTLLKRLSVRRYKREADLLLPV